MGGLYCDLVPEELRALRVSLWGVGTGGIQEPLAGMANLKELEIVAKEMLGKLKSNLLFQSKWDTAHLVIFFIVLGMVSASGPSASHARPQA